MILLVALSILMGILSYNELITLPPQSIDHTFKSRYSHFIIGFKVETVINGLWFILCAIFFDHQAIAYDFFISLRLGLIIREAKNTSLIDAFLRARLN